jgi:hypothetical protein
MYFLLMSKPRILYMRTITYATYRVALLLHIKYSSFTDTYAHLVNGYVITVFFHAFLVYFRIRTDRRVCLLSDELK